MTPVRKDWLQGRKTAAGIALGALLLAVAGCSGVETGYDRLKARSAAYLAAHPDLDARTAEAIRTHRIVNGMNKEQVVAAWGRPAVVKRFSQGRVEQWFFGCDFPHTCSPPSGFKEALSYSEENYYDSQAYFVDGLVTDVKG